MKRPDFNQAVEREIEDQSRIRKPAYTVNNQGVSLWRLLVTDTETWPEFNRTQVATFVAQRNKVHNATPQAVPMQSGESRADDDEVHLAVPRTIPMSSGGFMGEDIHDDEGHLAAPKAQTKSTTSGGAKTTRSNRALVWSPTTVWSSATPGGAKTTRPKRHVEKHRPDKDDKNARDRPNKRDTTSKRPKPN